MKFTPITSSSPRVLASETIASDPPVHLEVVFDPKTDQRYLSIGIGGKTVRRAWLSEEDATTLTRKMSELVTMLWSK